MCAEHRDSKRRGRRTAAVRRGSRQRGVASPTLIASLGGGARACSTANTSVDAAENIFASTCSTVTGAIVEFSNPSNLPVTTTSFGKVPGSLTSAVAVNSSGNAYYDAEPVGKVPVIYKVTPPFTSPTIVNLNLNPAGFAAPSNLGYYYAIALDANHDPFP